MAIRGLHTTIPVPTPSPSAVLSTITPRTTAPHGVTTASTADLPALSWHTSWTEIPRTHLGSTSSTLSVADRAVLGVVLGAGMFTATTASAYAQPVSMTYTIDSGEAVATAHTVLFRPDGAVDYTPQVLAAVAALSDTPATLGLAHPVGPDKPNAKADVNAIQTRLAQLGYPVGIDGKYGQGTDRAIRVFEAMITGADDVAGTTGVITPGGALDRALSSSGAPRWVTMPLSGPGFVNIDHDGFSHGASMAADTIRAAGAYYQTNYLDAHPGKSLISVNDVSRAKGGPHADHESHQAGLDVDVSLPTLTGGTSTRVGWASYDRETTYAMIVAFAQNPQVERILFSDQVLLARIAKLDVPWKDKIMDGGAEHRNHFHVDIKPWTPPPATAGTPA